MINRFFNSWLESLALFIPRNAKLFFLVVLKTALSTYKHLAFYGWWAFLLVLISSSVALYLPASWFVFIKPIWLGFFWFFMIILSVRPSTKRKTWPYYLDYIPHFFFLLLVSFGVTGIMNLLLSLTYSLASQGSTILTYIFMLLLYPIVFLLSFSFDLYMWWFSPWLIFTALFVCDSHFSISRFMRSLWRALLMVIYNFPFCIIFYFALRWFLILVLYALHAFGVPSIVGNGLVLLFSPVPIVIFTCFYTKRLHDQFGYYFPDTTKS
jgi:hypothetical protein